MLDPFQSFQVVPKMINSDQTKSCILMRWMSSTQRLFIGFFRIAKPNVLRAMLMIIFWKLNIVKTTSKKTRALIYSMKLLSPEAAVYLNAAKLSFLFVLYPWFFVEMWLSLWNMIGVLSMAKVLLQTGYMCSSSSFLQTSFLLLLEFESFDFQDIYFWLAH